MDSSQSETAGRHISQIDTLWPVLMQAHAGAPDEVNLAQQAILQRYRPAIQRYLLACLGNPDAADEVGSEFSLRFLRGDFRNANPEKGRFRDLLKSALYHLMIDYHKRRQRGMANLSPENEDPVATFDSTYDSDREFLKNWQANLLNKAWDTLGEEEKRTGRPLYTVLHFRAAHPDKRSHEMAEQLSRRLGKELTADWVRKWLSAARDRFADILLREVAASLRNPTPDSVEEELIDLGLFEYCKSALATWRSDLAG
ncbi:MAG: hypothetical protein U0840_15090 [Gemmataceae bacterium]